MLENNNQDNSWSIEYVEDGKSYLTQPVISLPILATKSFFDTVDRDNNVSNKVEKALFMMSQTRIGRHLLKIGQEENIKITIDDERFENREGVKAELDKKDIFLQSKYEAEELAFSLIHELMHVSQDKKEILGGYLFSYRLDRAIQLTWGKESEAYSASAQFAAELSIGDPKAPENAWKNQSVLDILKVNDPVSHMITQAVLQNNEDDMWNGNHMAMQFHMFYTRPEDRDLYAQHVIEYFNKAKDALDVLQNLSLYTDDFDHSDLKKEFNYLGKPYLSNDSSGINLQSGNYGNMSKGIKEEIISFYDQFFISHGKQKKAVKKIETYDSSDVAPKIYISKNKGNTP